ncbi:unnamed protein product [Linum trigynum]|uniref:Uncharacterized protein n=1 Tax=Linum trigynum TaxID=586398 RepID=A0AAV2F909_9ROSI
MFPPELSTARYTCTSEELWSTGAEVGPGFGPLESRSLVVGARVPILRRPTTVERDDDGGAAAEGDEAATEVVINRAAHGGVGQASVVEEDDYGGDSGGAESVLEVDWGGRGTQLVLAEGAGVGGVFGAVDNTCVAMDDVSEVADGAAGGAELIGIGLGCCRVVDNGGFDLFAG